MSNLHQVGVFVKISPRQWRLDALHTYINTEEECMEAYRNLELPKRSTGRSAGYDFRAPFDFIVEPGKFFKMPTCTCCDILDGWYLQIVPRSSTGIKFHNMMANTVAVVDADYYDADNEGHIWLVFHNYGTEPWTVHAGDRVAQGILLPYGITTDDAPASAQRRGGIGSTGR